MEKQHNRGQDGAGIATVKLNVEPGYPFLHRIRSNANQPIADIFSRVGKEIEEVDDPACEQQPERAVGAEQERAEQPDACRKIDPVHAAHELGVGEDFLIGPERADKDGRRSDDGA